MPGATSLTIASRFKGPPDSGNGGYVCGAFAVVSGDRDKTKFGSFRDDGQVYFGLKLDF